MSDFDAVVVGAGATGVAMAVELAERGLRVAVIERHAPGTAATSASFGLLHSGLRYLQSMDFARARRSRRDQGWWSRRLPGFVHAVECAMPLYAGCLRSPLALRTAFLCERVSGAGLPPQARAVHAAEAFAVPLPVPRRKLAGWACWEERELHDAPGAMRHLLEGVTARGGASLTGTDVLSLRVLAGRVTGVRVRRREGEPREIELRSPHVLLCAGAQSRTLARRLARDDARLSCARLAFNLVLEGPRPRGVLALSPEPGRGRSLFLRPQGDLLLAGTWYAPWHDGAAPRVTETLVAAALDDLARCLPGVAFRRDLVRGVLADALPDMGGAGMRLRERDVVVDHGLHGGPRGLVSVLGTKLTTAPSLASRVAGRLLAGTPSRSVRGPGGAAWPGRSEAP